MKNNNLTKNLISVVTYYWLSMMLLILCTVFLVFTYGCATPSYEKETYQILPGKELGTYTSMLTSKEKKYDNSTFYGGKLVGLEINYDPETYTPRIVMRYGRYESGRVRQGQAYLSTFGLDDISIIKGSLGGAKSTIAVFDSDYISKKEKEDAIDIHKDNHRKVTKESLSNTEDKK